jgi:membrane protein
LKATIAAMRKDRVPLVAAGMGFYWFLSVFPLLIAAIGIIALAHVGSSMVTTINDAIHTALPGEAAGVLTTAVSRAQTQTGGGLAALVVSVLVAVWSASSGMAAMQEGLDVAYGQESRKFLKKRLVGIVLILATLVLGGLAMALIVFGTPLGVWVLDHVPDGHSLVWAWTVVRWVLAIPVIMALFGLFYRLGPNRPQPAASWLSPGAIVGAGIWVAVSLGFSFYISNFGGSYGDTYGALAGVVLLLLWLYLTAIAVLLGGELNGELERQRARRMGIRAAPDAPAA